MIADSGFIASYTGSPFWYQKFDLKRNRILRGTQPFVTLDAADNSHVYVTGKKAMIFQDDITSIPIDNVKDLFVLVFDYTSMQNATETCH